MSDIIPIPASLYSPDRIATVFYTGEGQPDQPWEIKLYERNAYVEGRPFHTFGIRRADAPGAVRIIDSLLRRDRCFEVVHNNQPEVSAQTARFVGMCTLQANERPCSF